MNEGQPKQKELNHLLACQMLIKLWFESLNTKITMTSGPAKGKGIKLNSYIYIYIMIGRFQIIIENQYKYPVTLH